MTGQLLRKIGWVLVVLAASAAVAQAAGGPASAEPVTNTASVVAHAFAFWPDLGPTTLAWFAAVVILALTLRLRPLLSLRNLDALVLVGMCLLLVLRHDTQMPVEGGYSWRWWAYVGLTVAAGYWVVRGVQLLGASGTWRYEGNVSRGAITVLLLAGLAIGVQHVVTAPISEGSRDAVVGGLFTLETGKLPYDDVAGYDARSPLLYLIHAGAEWLVPPIYESPEGGGGVPMSWENRDTWLTHDWLQASDLSAARLVNALLFVGVLIGLYVIGRLLKSPAVGPTMMAIFCVFPGTLECLSRPEVMLSSFFLTWTIVFALLPVVGGLLATLCLVLAGVAWPWAWLGLPVLLAYFLRRGWQLVGASLGLLGGAALCAAGLLYMVQPALPRADGALRMAGLEPEYGAHVAEDGTLIIDQPTAAADVPANAISARLWRLLLTCENTTLDEVPSTVHVDWPNGVSGQGVPFRVVAMTGPARSLLEPVYRAGIAKLPQGTQVLVALRTVLAATWLPTYTVDTPVPSAWTFWAGAETLEGRWLLSRRLVKGGVVLLTLLIALAICVGRKARPRHLVAGLLVATSGALVASDEGAVTNLAWLLPVVLALWALHEVPESKVDAPGSGEFTETTDVSGEGGLPRISVEN